MHKCYISHEHKPAVPHIFEGTSAAVDGDGDGDGDGSGGDDENDKRIAAVMEELDMKRFYDECAGLTVAVSMEYSREAENLATILTYQLAGGELGSSKLAEPCR